MKRILSLFLAVALAFSCSLAATASVTTNYGDWTIEKYHSGSSWQIVSYNGSDTKVSVFSEYVTLPCKSIGAYAFVSNSKLGSVTIPASVSNIGEYAFLNNTALSSVTLSSGLSTMGDGAFSGTSALKAVNLEATSLTELNSYVFMNSGIVSLTLPQTLSTIKTDAFLQCGSLTALHIPASVTSIEKNAFENCPKLTIYCETNSAAHAYAVENNIKYVLTDAPSYLLGDTNGDGKINVIDATAIQRVLANLATDDGKLSLRGNVDGLHGLDIADVTYIQRWIAYYDDGLKIGEIRYY